MVNNKTDNKTDSVNNKTEKESVNSVVTQNDFNPESLLAENKELKNKYNKLESMLQQLLDAQEVQKIESVKSVQPTSPLPTPLFNEDDGDIYKSIELNKPIKVMSLYPGELNLRTSNEGNGQTFKFESFGSSRPIMYSDLVQIINNHPRFAKEGFFIILDKEVVKQHYLEDHYEKFLNKETIDNILNYDEKTIESLFKNSATQIRQTIASIIVHKIINGEYVDRNRVKIISELYGKDLFTEADRLK